MSSLMRSFRPSPEVEALARQIAATMAPLVLLHRKVPRSWKNRRIVDAATRLLASRKTFPNRIARQQIRRANSQGFDLLHGRGV